MRSRPILLLLTAAFLLSALPPHRPRILIIGDSISIGYFPHVKEALKDRADVVHNAGNAQHTETGLALVREWLGREKWDIIQFNWGLWDMCYRNPPTKTAGNRDKVKGVVTVAPETYRRNLDSLVQILKSTGARLVFVTTTYVPPGEPGRFTDDVPRYNAIAREVMKKYGVPVNDLYDSSVVVHRQYGHGAADVHYSVDGYKRLSVPVTKELSRQLDALQQ